MYGLGVIFEKFVFFGKLLRAVLAHFGASGAYRGGDPFRIDELRDRDEPYFSGIAPGFERRFTDIVRNEAVIIRGGSR
jgi:hypothetical protein